MLYVYYINAYIYIYIYIYTLFYIAVLWVMGTSMIWNEI